MFQLDRRQGSKLDPEERLGEDPAGGLSDSVLGREEGPFLDVVSGFRTDAHSGKDGCVQVFDGNGVLDRH